MAENAYHLKWNHHMQNMYRQLDTLFSQQEFVDVTLSCSDGLLKAHRLILSACSPYFENIFKDNTCKHPILILKEVSTKEMSCLLKFMYKGSVDVLDEDLKTFLSTASELKIRGLADEVAKESDQMEDQKEGEEILGMNETEVEKCDIQNIKVEENSEFNNINGMEEYNLSMENSPEEINDTSDEDRDETGKESKLQTHSDSPREEAALIKTAYSSDTSSFNTEVSYPRDTRFKGRKRVSVGAHSIDRNDEESEQGCCETVTKKRNIEPHPRPVMSSNLVYSEKSDVDKQDVGLLAPNALSEKIKEKEDMAMFCISSLNKCNTSVDCETGGERRGLRNTVCAFCFLDCQTSADLKKHVRIHTGEKSYECDLCNLAFSRASHLIRHKRVHTGEKPFTCIVCGHKFSRRDKLLLHARRHHNLDGIEHLGLEPLPRGRPRIRCNAPMENTSAEAMLQSLRQLGECTIHLHSGERQSNLDQQL